jgi:hypothetical protein
MNADDLTANNVQKEKEILGYSPSRLTHQFEVLPCGKVRPRKDSKQRGYDTHLGPDRHEVRKNKRASQRQGSKQILQGLQEFFEG